MPKVQYRSNCKPSTFAYPPPLEVPKEKEKEKVCFTHVPWTHTDLTNLSLILKTNHSGFNVPLFFCQVSTAVLSITAKAKKKEKEKEKKEKEEEKMEVVCMSNSRSIPLQSTSWNL